MFDALAAGKPVVINVGAWLGETIENNDCGRYVDPLKSFELANALEDLESNKKLCKKMGKNARALADQEFSREKLANKLENIFLNIISSF